MSKEMLKEAEVDIVKIEIGSSELTMNNPG
jgi:hypothetical protein